MRERIPAQVLPPSIFILDELAARGWARFDIVRRSHLSASELDDIIDQYVPITEHSAQQLGRAFGTSSMLWLRLDASFRPAFDGFVQDIEDAVREDPTFVVSADGVVSDA